MQSIKSKPKVVIPLYPWIASGKSTLVHNGNFNAGITGWSLFLFGRPMMQEVFAAKFASGRQCCLR